MKKGFFATIERALKWFLSSFDTSSTGSSARKLSAFVAVSVCLLITYRNTDRDNLAEILIIWLMFAALCLSIVTIEQVIRFREGKTSSVTTTKETTTLETKEAPL